jgi:hypothetical protein
LKLANDANARKNVRRQRKISYNQSQKKLKELEFKVASLKHSKNAQAKRAKQPRPLPAPAGSQFDGRRMSGGPPRSAQAAAVAEELRRGKSVPDLGQGGGGRGDLEGLDSEEEEEEGGGGGVGQLVSPRSCPSSPRKQSLGLPHHDSAGLLHPAHPRSVEGGEICFGLL